MTAVRNLRPGEVVQTGDMTAVFITAHTPHPLHPTLALVIWRLADGTLSLDALSPHQDVGRPVPSTAPGRAHNLRAALLHPTQV